MSGYSTSYQRAPGGWELPEDLQPESATMPEETARASDTTTEPSTSSQSTSTPRRPRGTHWRPRTCRICLERVYPTFDTEEVLSGIFQPDPTPTYDSEGGRLIRPCRCKGSSRYVHEKCLQEWRHADPHYGRRNFWQCPTCQFEYRLERVRWGRWVQSQVAQIFLTILIFLSAVFILGFIADPIINLYLDPVGTVTSIPGMTHDVYDDYRDWDEDQDDSGWTEHFIKGIASLGLLGFLQTFLMNPWNWLNLRHITFGGGGGRRAGTTGRERINNFTWILVFTGIVTFLYTVWKYVRRWSRIMLEKAGEHVMDVQGDVNDNDEDYSDTDDPNLDNAGSEYEDAH